MSADLRGRLGAEPPAETNDDSPVARVVGPSRQNHNTLPAEHRRRNAGRRRRPAPFLTAASPTRQCHPQRGECDDGKGPFLAGEFPAHEEFRSTRGFAPDPLVSAGISPAGPDNLDTPARADEWHHQSSRFPAAYRAPRIVRLDLHSGLPVDHAQDAGTEILWCAASYRGGLRHVSGQWFSLPQGRATHASYAGA